MKLKSYFSASVEAAMQQARQELGDEAMLLNSRPASGESRRLGAHEVIFALPDPADMQSASANSATARRTSPEPSSKLEDDLVNLRREMHQIRQTMARTTDFSPRESGVPDPEINRIRRLLLARDVSSDVAESVVQPCLRKTKRDDAGLITRKSLQIALREEMLKKLRAQPEFKASTAQQGQTPRLVIFVGPPGSGKTSALIKVAIRNGLQNRKPLLVVSLDNYRVAGAEQLRAYACILGVGFQHVETVRAMRAVLEEHRHKYWIFVDTPGCGPKEADVIQELSEITKLENEIETHLVLSAAMKSSDLRVAVKRFAPLNPGKLLFTHLDETEHYGGVLSAAAISGRAVSFLSFGQRIPEDLEPATCERLVALVFPDSELCSDHDESPPEYAGTAAAGY